MKHIKENGRGEFPRYMKELGARENVRVLDLHAKTLEEYNKYTDEELQERFCKCYNRFDGSFEVTHYQPLGAKTVASWIKELACEEPEGLLCSHFR